MKVMVDDFFEKHPKFSRLEDLKRKALKEAKAMGSGRTESKD